MPITSSAKKALRVSGRRAVLNFKQRDAMRRSVKELKKAVISGVTDASGDPLSRAYQALDKAAKKGLIKKNTASRKKSRLAKLVKKIAPSRK